MSGEGESKGCGCVTGVLFLLLLLFYPGHGIIVTHNWGALLGLSIVMVPTILFWVAVGIVVIWVLSKLGD
jgi:hypothetical protein